MADTERKLVMRSDNVMFYGVPDSSGGTVKYYRMRGFKSLGTTMNPIEYSSRYVDEKFEQKFVTGYSPTIEFECDEYTPDEVIDHLSSLIENEAIGSDAVISLVNVFFAKPNEEGTGYKAWKREFSLQGATAGEGTDAYTYTGSFNVTGNKVFGTATITEPVDGKPETAMQITFTPDEESV